MIKITYFGCEGIHYRPRVKGVDQGEKNGTYKVYCESLDDGVKQGKTCLGV
jgi:hypothetical protein